MIKQSQSLFTKPIASARPTWLQLKPRRSVGEEVAASLAAARHSGSLGSGGSSLTGLEGSMADLSLSGMSGSSGVGGGAAAEGGTAALDRATEWQCCAYLAPEGSFCLRANTLQGYADCNRCGLRRWVAEPGCCLRGAGTAAAAEAVASRCHCGCRSKLLNDLVQYRCDDGCRKRPNLSHAYCASSRTLCCTPC